MKATELIKQLTGTIEKNNDALREEFQKKYDERNVDNMEALAKQTTEALEQLKEWQGKIERTYSLPGSGPDEAKDNETISVGKVGLAMRIADKEKVALKDVLERYKMGFANEVFVNMRERAMDSGDSSAGNLIPEQQMTDIIEPLRADVVALALGATEIPFTNGFPVVFPKQLNDVTASWTGEGSTISDSEINTSKMTLTPRSLTAAVIASNLSIEQASPAMDVLIRRSFMEQFVRALDIAALNGAGANAPAGVIQVASTTVDFSTATMTYTLARTMERELRRNNAYRGSLGWAFHPDVQFDAETVPSDNNSPTTGNVEMARRMFTEGPLENFLGRPFRTTTNLPDPGTGTVTGAAIFGNWADMIIGMFKAMELRASDTAGNVFLNDQTVIRGVMRADIGFWHEKSFVIAENYGS